MERWSGRLNRGVIPISNVFGLRWSVVALLVCSELLISAGSVIAAEWRAYVGTYTGGASEGIYALRFDDESGDLSVEGLVAQSENPSFLAIHPTKPLLYAVNEVGSYGGEASGYVTAFRISDDDGTLTELNRVSSKGAAPCHLVVDREGRHVLVANYSGGSVTVLAIREDGSLGEATSHIQHEGSSVNARRQAGPHAHSVNLSPRGDYAYVADLGIDQTRIYEYDARRGRLTPNSPAFVSHRPGAGPRHFDISPTGDAAFGINELDSTVTRYAFDAESGHLSARQVVSTLPESDVEGKSTADIHVHPSGRFVYGSNRGDDSIVVFGVDEDTGALRWVENEPTGGRTPRNFALDPSGRFLLAENQNSDSVFVFRINPESGALESTGVSVSVPSPVCIQFREIK